MGRLRILAFVPIFVGMTFSGLARSWFEEQPPVEAVASKDGGFVVYNVSDNDLVAVFGTFEYTSPTTGKVVVTEWEKFLVSPLVRPLKPLSPADSFRFRRTLHPSGKEYIKPRNIVCTGALTSLGQTWGPRGRYLKAALASQASDAYTQLLEIKSRLSGCDRDEAAKLLRSPDPMVLEGRNTGLVHATLQRLLFADEDLKELSVRYRDQINELIDSLEPFLIE